MPRRILNGIVVSDKAHKTVIVRVERRVVAVDVVELTSSEP